MKTPYKTKSNILFVDDEINVIDALKRSLRPLRNEWDMTFVLSVEEALEKVATNSFDLIISDINMPGKDGLELLKILDEKEILNDVLVIILTGQADKDLKRKALDVGATDLLNKPFEREDLLARIRSALRLKASQDKVKSQNILLDEKVKELQKLETMRTELFNMLVHDLKTPISVIIGNLDLIRFFDLSEIKDFIDSAQTACDYLYRMVSDMLDIARLEEGGLKLSYEKIDPENIIIDSLASISGIGKIKNLKLVYSFNSLPIDKEFFCDQGLIMRVIQNLVSNAIYYSPQDETIEIGFRYIDSNKIQFFVNDNGRGVPPEYQQKIFDKFVQVGDKKKDGRIYTTGLGLTFCKMAINAHDGTIYVESDGKKGSSFKFEMPLT
ncbi:MAG: response regulator [Desulfobacterales bacterium]|nr:response regulator [Desulfobacterales bacterium]